MKKIILFVAFVSIFAGCSPKEDNSTKFHLEILPIETAVFPAQFIVNTTYDIPISYKRPTICYIFEGFYYDKNLNTRTIAIETSVVEQDNCTPALQNPVTEYLHFRPTVVGSYVFKLWKGKDTAGVNQYQEITVPVVP
jgi:hypothetical protein